MPNRKQRILVVDDEEKITCGIRHNLELTGEFEVLEENRGTHAVITTQRFLPDLILLDVVMPDIEGGDVADEIRQIPGFKHIPIVFLTGRAATVDEIKKGGGYIGGERFLHKPVALHDLIECIHEELQKASLLPHELKSAEDTPLHIAY